MIYKKDLQKQIDDNEQILLAIQKQLIELEFKFGVIDHDLTETYNIAITNEQLIKGIYEILENPIKEGIRSYIKKNKKNK